MNLNINGRVKRGRAMFEEEDPFEEEMEEEEDFCDYGVSEFCSDPQTKSLGLCTTECQGYLQSVKEDQVET